MNETEAMIMTGSESTAIERRRESAHAQAAASYIENLAPGSRRTMIQSLAAITDILLDRKPAFDPKRRGLIDVAAENARRVSGFHWGDLRAEHTAAIRARLMTGVSPDPDGASPSMSVATANKALVALRKVLFESWKLGLIGREDYEKAVAFDRIAGDSPKKGRALSAREALKLALSCEEDSTPLGARDGVIVALLLFAGLRRFELAALTAEDWNAGQHELTVQYGKGRKSRVVPVPDGVAVALERWLSVRGFLLSSAKEIKTDRLLFGLTKGHQAYTSGLTTDAIFKALLQRAKRAGVDTFSPHDLRRTYIGDLLDAGADLATAQQLAGHSDPKTTAGYDRRPREIRRAAVRKLNAPFSRRA